MSVSNVTMFEFDTSEELQEWSDWYRDNGPFPNNTLSLFVKTGDTSALGISVYPDEESRAAADGHRDASAESKFSVREIVYCNMGVRTEHRWFRYLRTKI